MPRPSDEARRLAEAWRLGWVPAPPRGRAGEHLGRGTGSSLEFQDRRHYQAGDDVRHLDWRAFARTGQLSVKLYREEVLPRLDLVVDTSASMSVGESKPGLHLDLVVFLALAARRSGLSVKVILLDDRPRALELERLEGEGLELEGAQPLSTSIPSALGIEVDSGCAPSSSSPSPSSRSSSRARGLSSSRITFTDRPERRAARARNTTRSRCRPGFDSPTDIEAEVSTTRSSRGRTSSR